MCFCDWFVLLFIVAINWKSTLLFGPLGEMSIQFVFFGNLGGISNFDFYCLKISFYIFNHTLIPFQKLHFVSLL